MSPAERRALITVLSLGVGGHLIRASGTGLIAPPPAEELLDPAADGDPFRQLAASLARDRPLGVGERIDADTAGARELERLPGIGPALARRIVADRQTKGAFGGIAALERVPGIGPNTIDRLAPYLSFSGRPSDDTRVGATGRLLLNRAGIAELQALPGIGPARARAIVAFRDSAGPFRNIDQLGQIPGISPAMVARLALEVQF